MYHNEDVFKSLGKEMCISLDVALVAAKLSLKVFTALLMCIKRMVASQMKCSPSMQLSTGVCHILFLAKLR